MFVPRRALTVCNVISAVYHIQNINRTLTSQCSECLVQRSGLFSHSPGEAIDSQTHFLCQGISPLLKQTQTLNTQSHSGVFLHGPKLPLPHLSFCFGINSDDILCAGGSHEGAGKSVVVHRAVDGVLEPRWRHRSPLCVGCVDHPPVRHLDSRGLCVTA